MQLDQVDIDSDPELQARYDVRIPVLATTDGRILCEGKISESRARQALKELYTTP